MVKRCPDCDAEVIEVKNVETGKRGLLDARQNTCYRLVKIDWNRGSYWDAKIVEGIYVAHSLVCKRKKNAAT